MKITLKLFSFFVGTSFTKGSWVSINESHFSTTIELKQKGRRIFLLSFISNSLMVTCPACFIKLKLWFSGADLGFFANVWGWGPTWPVTFGIISQRVATISWCGADKKMLGFYKPSDDRKRHSSSVLSCAQPRQHWKVDLMSAIFQ